MKLTKNKNHIIKKNKPIRKKNKITRKKYQKGGILVDSHEVQINGDGNCMYRAVIYQLLVNIDKTHNQLLNSVYRGSQINFTDIKKLKQQIKDNKDPETLKYIENLKDAIYHPDYFYPVWNLYKERFKIAPDITTILYMDKLDVNDQRNIMQSYNDWKKTGFTDDAKYTALGANFRNAKLKKNMWGEDLELRLISKYFNVEITIHNKIGSDIKVEGTNISFDEEKNKTSDTETKN